MFCHASASGKASYCLLFKYKLVVLLTVPWEAIYPLLLQLDTSFQKPSVQSCWPLSPVSLELFVHSPTSNKAVQVLEEGTLYASGSPSLWDGTVDSTDLVR